MHRTISLTPIAAALLLLLAGCRDSAELPEQAAQGPNPSLPAPNERLIPTVNIAPATGWPQGETPEAAEGLAVTRLRQRASIIRAGSMCCRTATCWSPRPMRRRSRKTAKRHQRLDHEAWAMKRAGAGVPSANRITLLRDADGDGVAETTQRLPRGAELAVRHGAGRRRALRRRYRCGAPLRLHRRRDRDRRRRAPRWPTCRRDRSTITGPRTSIASAGRHRASMSTVGSNSNAGENGLGPGDRAARAIWEIDPATGEAPRLRHGLAQSGRLGVRAANRRAVGGGERARRARQRSRARLSHLGEGRRVLRLAVQLLGPARRRVG